ncbi:MAG TPA: 3'-5' exonuclease, partial [Candidatus Doudnabacteria bacterium]|nr:3'-5' exonuclease [Candidatus Doudnabacteria bacterium]
SIDLEFTGFDPEIEQILEIGFAFFDITDEGIVVGEKWSQVFKPSIEVHQKILGLTGITQAEIDVAPDVAEYRDFLTEKLRDKILVAHNPVLDVKFLEQVGVILSGRVIDTLELVQFLLPTHHSYNLENLMHYFAIKHADSHRALGDALSTISLLEKMLGIHAALPQEVKTELNLVLCRGEFEWKSLLEYNFKPTDSSGRDSLSHGEEIDDSVIYFDEQIVVDENHFQHESRIAKTLQNQSEKTLMIISDKQEVLRLWKAGLVEGVFEARDLYNDKSFNEFLNSATTSEELRFCMKIIVWRKTNWQTKSVLDLNLSFFGGQFKNYIVDGKFQSSNSLIAACDYQTFLELASLKLETDRQLVICDLQRFERFLTFGSREWLSWNSFNFMVKSIFNPETGFGQVNLKTEVLDTLASIDLFFGLVQIMLRLSSKQTDYIALADLEILQPVYYRRLVSAAKHLSEKLSLLGDNAVHHRVGELAGALTKFFEIEENQVKWVELTEGNVVMHSQPIQIAELAQSYFTNYQDVKLTDTVSDFKLLFYLVERLGFNPEIVSESKNSKYFDHEQLDLVKHKPDEVKELIQAEKSPLVVIFPNPAQVKSFYKEHFLELKEQYKLFGQDYSGSGNKIFRNFRISGNSLLLATSHFVNKQKYTAPASTVIFLEMPKVDLNQPYYQALGKIYESKYPNLPEILSTGEFILNIKQLSGKNLPKIIIMGSKH